MGTIKNKNKNINIKMSSRLGLGFVSSCVGPVVDISMSTQNHAIYQLQSLWVSLGLSENLGLSCIYDALLLIRPECSFREGIMMRNRLAAKRKFYEALGREESLVLGLMAQQKLSYSKLKTSEILKIKDEIRANLETETAGGLAAALILVKTYINWLVVEVNQICYGGTTQTIILGFTEGISSWKVESLCTFRSLVVPVGRSTLGRLFSVLGATIDAYVGIDELPLYSDYILHFDQCEVETSSTELHRVQSRCAKEEKIIKIRTEETLCATEFLSSSKFIHTSLRNFTYLKEVILQQKTETAQLKELGSLGFLNIMGIGSEIIKTRELNPLSFSNVSSEAAEAYKVL